jgi:hypothetical protein
MMTAGWAVMSSALCSSVHNGLTRVASVRHSPLVLRFLNLRSTMTLGSALARPAMSTAEAALPPLRRSITKKLQTRTQLAEQIGGD